MKASELIHNGLYKVGDDIVRFRALNVCLYRPNGCFYGQLYENSEDGSLEVHVFNGAWKKLRPLPLIEEMLKADGYEDCGYYLVKDWSEGNIFDKGYKSNYVQLTKWSMDGDLKVFALGVILDNVATINVKVRYVHELQRALRCCGLWDFANDFNVK